MTDVISILLALLTAVLMAPIIHELDRRYRDEPKP